ncbi:MAG: hypothetical protein AB1813_15920 [Verrucomicrobiota bacterium]
MSGGVPVAFAQADNAAAATGSDSYVLGPMDILAYEIQEDPKRKEPVQCAVGVQGDVSFRVSQGYNTTIDLKVTGKTIEEVRRLLKARLEENFYTTATVQLNLKQAAIRQGTVYFTGEVRGNTLQIQPSDKKTLSQALIQIGVTEFANLSKVRLLREDLVNKTNIVRYVNVKKINEGDRTEEDPILQDKDRIDVRGKLINF